MNFIPPSDHDLDQAREASEVGDEGEELLPNDLFDKDDEVIDEES